MTVVPRSRLAQILALALVVCGLGLALSGFGLAGLSWYGQREARSRWNEPVPARWMARNPQITRLSIPSLNVERYVYSGASAANLAKGPAWLSDSSEPGHQGNCVIAGHRDTHFAVLRNVRKGDDIIVDNGPEQFRYRITSIDIVNANESWPIRQTKEPVLTLVTCYPFRYVGAAPKRYTVRARLVNSDNREPTTQ